MAKDGSREEFERLGELLVYDNTIYNDEAKRGRISVAQCTGPRCRRDRESQTFWYSKWIFIAAVAGVIIGFVGLLVAFLHR